MIFLLEEVKPKHLPGGLTHEAAMKNLRFFARCAIACLTLRRLQLRHPRWQRALCERDRKALEEFCVRGEFLNEALIAEILEHRTQRRLRQGEQAA